MNLYTITTQIMAGLGAAALVCPEQTSAFCKRVQKVISGALYVVEPPQGILMRVGRTPGGLRCFPDGFEAKVMAQTRVREQAQTVAVVPPLSTLQRAVAVSPPPLSTLQRAVAVPPPPLSTLQRAVAVPLPLRQPSAVAVTLSELHSSIPKPSAPPRPTELSFEDHRKHTGTDSWIQVTPTAPLWEEQDVTDDGIPLAQYVIPPSSISSSRNRTPSLGERVFKVFSLVQTYLTKIYDITSNAIQQFYQNSRRTFCGLFNIDYDLSATSSAASKPNY